MGLRLTIRMHNVLAILDLLLHANSAKSCRMQTHVVPDDLDILDLASLEYAGGVLVHVT